VLPSSRHQPLMRSRAAAAMQAQQQQTPPQWGSTYANAAAHKTVRLHLIILSRARATSGNGAAVALGRAAVTRAAATQQHASCDTLVLEAAQ